MSTQDQRISAFVKVMPKHLARSSETKKRIQWDTVADELSRLGVSDGNGLPWGRKTAQNFFKNYKEQIEALVGVSKDSKENTTEQTRKTSKGTSKIAKPDVQVAPEPSSKDSATGETSKPSKRGAIQKTRTQGDQTEHDVPIEPLSTDSKEIATREEQVMEEIVKSYESGELKELIEWWSARKNAPLHRSHVPLFRKDLEYKITGIRVKKEIAKRASEKLEDPELRASYGASMSNLIEILLWEFIGKPSDVLAGDSHD